MDSGTQRASGTIVDPRASLAMWLRTGRTQKNLSLEDVARITKIQARILDKLETGNLEGLPADVFVKGFVRSFAKCCGLDEKEAIERLGAAQSGQPAPATTVARAFVDSMSVRVLDAQPAAEPVVAAEPVASEPVVATEPVAAEPVVAAAPAIEVIEIADAAPLAASAAGDDVATPKKKRTRRARSRKKKTAGAIIAQAVIDQHTPVEPPPVVATDTTDASDDAVVEAALAEGSARISSNQIEIAVAIDAQPEATESADAADAAQDIAGTWQPTMPPLSTVPSVPWRRPQLPQHTTYVQPHLVIDDADPDSADREREHRNAREHSRLSFLPPILLDREDRSARQGGLTLAVIILLIAATLTLSYLMRRPSARGDGVTMLDGQTELLG
jgi:cytoskeletal protein RodZ